MIRNHHLNIFRYFNEFLEKEVLENNLSRAFALCLENNGLFLNEYLQAIVSTEDYDYLFKTISSDTQFTLNLQIDTSNIDQESYQKVYAIAMTTEKNLDMSDFFQNSSNSVTKNITDIFISIKDIAFIIEVKKNNENCKAQLYNQICPFLVGSNQSRVVPKNFSWQEVIKIMEKVKNLQKLVSQESIFITDFLQLSELHYTFWFEPKPFNVLKFSNNNSTPEYQHLVKRMRQGLASSNYEVLDYNDRLGIAVPWKWASEIIPEFQTYEDVGDCVVFYIWPGNTKQQGYSVYNNSLDWIKNKRTLVINQEEYELEIAYNIKLSHFNKYISGLNFYDQDLIEKLHTKEHFYAESGKWDRNRWIDFEKLMDNHFNPKYRWREYCKWEQKFIKSDRQYFTLSLGFEVCVFIPFSKFKDMDRKDEDIMKISEFINEIASGFQSLLS